MDDATATVLHLVDVRAVYIGDMNCGKNQAVSRLCV